ncbi:MAG: PAS domain S-box protein [Syntrophobacteraceae bacterium]|nr:PAS domain S-box protein [Desulfobacteraceae bacterium]
MDEIVTSGIAFVFLAASGILILRASALAGEARACLFAVAACVPVCLPHCLAWVRNAFGRGVPPADMSGVWTVLVLSLLVMAMAVSSSTPFRARLQERLRNRRPCPEDRPLSSTQFEVSFPGQRKAEPDAEAFRNPAPAQQTACKEAPPQDFLGGCARFVELFPEAAFAVDLTGRVIAWNRAIEALTGVEKAQVLGRSGYAYSLPFYGDHRPVLIDLVRGADPVFEQQYDLIAKEGESLTAERYAPLLHDGGGAHLRATAYPLLENDGSIVGAVEFIRDITERKNAGPALKGREDRYRAIFEASRDPICITGRDCRLVEVNRSAQDLFGYSCEEMIGMHWSALCPDLECLAVFRDGIGENGSASEFQGAFRKKDGTQVQCIVTAIVRRAPDGTFLGGQAIIRDVTELKKLEQQFLQSQKMEAVGRLAGGVAHDFNNLLTAIMGYSQILLCRTGEESPLRRYVYEIDRAAGRAADLTRQLLAFSRRQVFQPSVVNLDALIGKMDNMLRRIIGEDIHLTVVPNPEPCRVKADPGQIEQVVMNLAVNARDAMPGGGRLTIKAVNTDLTAEHFHRKIAVQPGPYVLLTVSDTGTGMDESVLPFVFEPFFTTKEPGKGTGLGLSTVYGIVKQSGGFVFVDSEPGKGSVFKLYLPRVENPVCVEGKPDPVPECAQAGETVLVVEDENAVRTLVCDALRENGYNVLGACHGREALALAENYGASIHLLLTDVVMPEMNGLELAGKLSALRSNMKVLYMTGYTENGIVGRDGLRVGVNLLRKPFTPDGLKRKVQETLAGSASGLRMNGPQVAACH